jgi:hypothetical protein
MIRVVMIDVSKALILKFRQRFEPLKNELEFLYLITTNAREAEQFIRAHVPEWVIIDGHFERQTYAGVRLMQGLYESGFGMKTIFFTADPVTIRSSVESNTCLESKVADVKDKALAGPHDLLKLIRV